MRASGMWIAFSVVLALAGCSKTKDNGQVMLPSGTAGMAPVTAGMGAPVAGTGVTAGTGAPVAGTGVTAGTGAPVAGMGVPAAGTGGGMTDASVPGDGGTTMNPMLGMCEGGSTEPCGTFVTNTGTQIPLGPYGAVMEPNVGTGFETTIALGDSDNNAICTGFAGGFGEDPAATMELLDITGLEMDLYTVYRPASWGEGEKFPLITWGNGTCAQPEGYGALLRYVASNGYIVVAANSRWVGGNGAMTRALDFMFAANDDPNSPYYQRIDTEKVGAMGHSQGSGATASAASDSRIDAVILFNGGNSASKPFFAISGDMDIGNPTANSFRNAVNGASGKAAFMFFHMVPATGTLSGHLTLMTQPERVTEATVGWWDVLLKEDAMARELFVGDSCGLCGRDAEFEFGQKGL